MLHQVHGREVVVVRRPGEHDGATADAAVTVTAACALAVRTADCGPVVLYGDGVIGVAHAGWRGLVAGVLDAVVAAMRTLGAADVRAELGACIRPECYEFGSDDLDGVASRLGDEVRSTTRTGAPALDLGAAVERSLDRLGVELLDHGLCTGCEPDRFFSHRARREPQRTAAFAWLEP